MSFPFWMRDTSPVVMHWATGSLELFSMREDRHLMFKGDIYGPPPICLFLVGLDHLDRCQSSFSLGKQLLGSGEVAIATCEIRGMPLQVTKLNSPLGYYCRGGHFQNQLCSRDSVVHLLIFPESAAFHLGPCHKSSSTFTYTGLAWADLMVAACSLFPLRGWGNERPHSLPSIHAVLHCESWFPGNSFSII